MESVINTIIDGARTGEIGDGKIFGNHTLLTIRFYVSYLKMQNEITQIVIVSCLVIYSFACVRCH